jgi:methylated-DNA-[protein]-cysteine S-methyltransferase
MNAEHSKAAARAALRQPAHATITWRRIDTPIGTFHVAALDGHLVQSALPGTDVTRFLADVHDKHPSIPVHEAPQDPLLCRAATQLEEYVAGERTTFDLPMRTEGTEFQKRVWTALTNIPYGETWTYGQLAQQVGRPAAFRAVGQANHHNPLAPFIPCHRVINAGGGLGGYGGGMDLKRALLRREGIHFDA